jgi:hypothetical protein
MPLEDTIPMKMDGANGTVVLRTNKGERLPRSWQDFPIWRSLENAGVSSETIGKGIGLAVSVSSRTVPTFSGFIFLLFLYRTM